MLSSEIGEAPPKSCVSFDSNKNFGVIILAPEPNPGLLFTTITSIKREYSRLPNMICVTSSDIHPTTLKEMEKYCPVFLGGNSITSLMNEGLERGINGWNIFVFAGAQLRWEATRKLMGFASEENCIIYPIVVDYDRRGRPLKIYSDFDEATINGMTIHKSTFEKIGKFSNNPIQVSKMFWSLDAWEKGCRFKAVLGAKII